MKEYIIKDDRIKLSLYTLLFLLLTLAVMLVCAWFIAGANYLGAFLGATALWFSVKYMCRYGKKLLANTPVCEFLENELVIHSLPGKAKVMRYDQISEARIWRDAKSVKLFLFGKAVQHPSGYYYVGVVYPFRRHELSEVEQQITDQLKRKKVSLAEAKNAAGQG